LRLLQEFGGNRLAHICNDDKRDLLARTADGWLRESKSKQRKQQRTDRRGDNSASRAGKPAPLPHGPPDQRQNRKDQ
jgi:hypothetical protein